jgi:hypothetical protein
MPLVLALMLAIPLMTRAQTTQDNDAEKTALARQFLEATGALEQAIRVVETNLPAQRAANPAIPAVFWDRLLAQVKARRNEFLDETAPVFARLFTVAELKGLVEFYGSPLGKRLLQIQPQMSKELGEAGQRWGQRLSVEVAQQLAAEGILR